MKHGWTWLLRRAVVVCGVLNRNFGITCGFKSNFSVLAGMVCGFTVRDVEKLCI